MTTGPEHFADLAVRYFALLKEMTMTATAEPSPIGANLTDPDPDTDPFGVAPLPYAAGPFCFEPTCPDFGDPNFGEGTCPESHATPAAGASLHYAKACRLLDEADRPGYNLGEIHERVERARGRLLAAQVAALLWPEPDAPDEDRAEDAV
jgi:hypothetical protein